MQLLLAMLQITHNPDELASQVIGFPVASEGCKGDETGERVGSLSMDNGHSATPMFRSRPLPKQIDCPTPIMLVQSTCYLPQCRCCSLHFRPFIQANLLSSLECSAKFSQRQHNKFLPAYFIRRYTPH